MEVDFSTASIIFITPGANPPCFRAILPRGSRHFSSKKKANCSHETTVLITVRKELIFQIR
jgi:hypothetical protein